MGEFILIKGANLRGGFDLFRTAFPDFKITAEDVLFDDKKAVWRWALSGTHDGGFMGIPATGNRVTLRAMTVARIYISTIKKGRPCNDYSYNGLRSQSDGRDA